MRELEHFVGRHREKILIKVVLLEELLNGQQGDMVLCIFLLNEHAFWVNFGDHIFARVGEVENSIVVFDPFLIGLFHKIVWFPVEVEFRLVSHEGSTARVCD